MPTWRELPTQACETSAADTVMEDTTHEARIELLQRMPVSGGIQSSVRIPAPRSSSNPAPVPASYFFFRERDKGDLMFVLEMGKAAVLKSWRGQDYLLRTLNEGDCFGEMAVTTTVHVALPSVRSKIVSQSIFQPPTSNQVYAQDLKQFALMQMNMGREVCRRLREADNMLFGTKLGMPHADIEHVFLAD